MKAIVTDDSKATRMILRRLLEDLRFEVQEAPDGASLIQMLQEAEEAVDLCLVDWNMPGLNGTEVIRVLQGNPDWADIPAILVTDETKVERIESALEAGALGYLGKPFRKEVLEETLAEIGLEI